MKSKLLLAHRVARMMHHQLARLARLDHFHARDLAASRSFVNLRRLMRSHHGYLATVPFDLYDLTLFDLVASTGGFTSAATIAGLTQSAMTRRIAQMETQLGVRLFERTTRKVHLTEAGRDLQARIAPLLSQTREIVRSFAVQQGLSRTELHVGISRSIGLSYLPGFFHAYAKKHPDVLLTIGQENSGTIIQKLCSGDLDAGIVHPPRALPRDLEITRSFWDDFVVIVPRDFAIPERKTPLSVSAAKALLAEARWLTISLDGNTGRGLRQWLSKHEWKIKPALELDSFDLIVNLVALGTGVAFVPHRVLPIYQNRRVVKRLVLRDKFRRQLSVVVRKTRKRQSHISSFVDDILF